MNCASLYIAITKGNCLVEKGFFPLRKFLPVLPGINIRVHCSWHFGMNLRQMKFKYSV